MKDFVAVKSATSSSTSSSSSSTTSLTQAAITKQTQQLNNKMSTIRNAITQIAHPLLPKDTGEVSRFDINRLQLQNIEDLLEILSDILLFIMMRQSKEPPQGLESVLLLQPKHLQKLIVEKAFKSNEEEEELDAIQPTSPLFQLVYNSNPFDEYDKALDNRNKEEEKRKEKLDYKYDKIFRKKEDRKFVKDKVLEGK
jgi:hypothetical protein